MRTARVELAAAQHDLASRFGSGVAYGDGSRRRKRLVMIRITSSAKWGVSWTR
jgi:hypothetical protein